MRRHLAGRWAVLFLVVLLGYFAFEEAIHTVHHLFEPDGSALCVVLSATQHVTGTLTYVATPYPPVVATDWPTVSGTEQLPPASRDFGPHEGRAPPSSPSA